MHKRFVTEIIEEKKRAVLVYKYSHKLTDYLKIKLSADYIVYESVYYPKTQKINSFIGYDLAIFIDVFPFHADQLAANKLNIFLIFYDREIYREKEHFCKKHLANYKIVLIEKTKRPLNEIIDFVLYKTPTPYSFAFTKKIIPRPFYRVNLKPKQIIYLFVSSALLFIFVLNLIFFTAFFFQAWLMYDLFKTPPKILSLHKTIKKLEAAQGATKKLVSVPKNTLFWVPGIEGFFKAYEVTINTSEFIIDSETVIDNYLLLGKLFLKKNKTTAEKKETVLRIDFLKNKIDSFGDRYYGILSGWRGVYIPFFNKKKELLVEKVEKFDEYINLLRTLTKELPYLGGVDKPRRYVLFFMNNMELRPGGGFIGSVGIIDFKDFSLDDFRVYDVYTLDGQLKVHIDPPAPIKTFLQQPHWFLRDSNFSPDFPTNVDNAFKFIESEVGWNEFDGAFGITFTAVQRIIGLFSDFYITGINERISPENFFIKAQTYAERDFFPGSHGKKNFLEAVVRTLLVKFSEGAYDPLSLAETARALLDEKFVVVYFKYEPLQTVFDRLFWTGRIVRPGCNVDKQCFFDYLLVTDANLGVNKANFFVQRSLHLTTRILANRTVENTLIIDYRNESVKDIFPGGDYKNYAQVYLPSEAQVISVSINGERLNEYKESSAFSLLRLDMFFSVKADAQKTLVIKYVYPRKINKDDTYQLIVQKQTGSINNDFVYEMKLDPRFSLSNTNFAAVVEKQGLVYNTYLEKDRLLLVWFR